VSKLRKHDCKVIEGHGEIRVECSGVLLTSDRRSSTDSLTALSASSRCPSSESMVARETRDSKGRDIPPKPFHQ
jgi:hypothetical protein